MNNHIYKENGGNFWIAIVNEEIVGTISLENIGNKKGLLKSLYVAIEYRNRKIATNLMDILLNFAKKKGYTSIELDTYEKFQEAIKLYEKMGFIKKEQIGEKQLYEKEI